MIANDTSTTMNQPRICAVNSREMLPSITDYFYGEMPREFNLNDNDYDSVLSLMPSPELYFFNGTVVPDEFGRLSTADATIMIETTDEIYTNSSYMLMVQGCENEEDLHELYLNVTINYNSPPYFTNDLDSTYSVAVGEQVSFELPYYTDAELND